MYLHIHIHIHYTHAHTRHGSNVEIGAKVSENMVDEISKFKKEIKFIYEEMNRPYYKSNAKNDPCGAKLEQFYHTAYNDMEVSLSYIYVYIYMCVCMHISSHLLVFSLWASSNDSANWWM